MAEKEFQTAVTIYISVETYSWDYAEEEITQAVLAMIDAGNKLVNVDSHFEIEYLKEV